jgi:hypothetical protein
MMANLKEVIHILISKHLPGSYLSRLLYEIFESLCEYGTPVYTMKVINVSSSMSAVKQSEVVVVE